MLSGLTRMSSEARCNSVCHRERDTHPTRDVSDRRSRIQALPSIEPPVADTGVAWKTAPVE